MDASLLRRFQDRLADARVQIGRVDFEWYPYDTLANLQHLEQLLDRTLDEFLREASPNRRILDVGCGDGELAFFLESLGYQAVAVDHPTHNHNGMRGVRALRKELGSSVELHEVDLDRQFQLPHESYDAAIFLGVLYHLRNPFYVLEEIAKRSKYCLLSTRIARRLPNGDRMPKGVPLAYLLDEHELNQDESNYFIFSEQGLRVLIERSYWRIAKSFTVGDSRRSDPVRQDRDERMFCLLESRHDRLANIELLDGWYEVEGSGWRWTARRFGLIARTQGAKKRTLSMHIFVPADLLARFPRIVLSLRADGSELTPEIFQRAGTHVVVREFSAAQDGVRFEFKLNQSLPPDDNDARERGIIVAGVTVE